MRPTLIRGRLLIDGTGGPPLPESVLLIDEGRIIAVGAAEAVGQPDHSQVIDARGMVVLPGMEVLVAATRGNAEALGLSNDLGTLEPGKLADVVLLEASPLEDIANSRRLVLQAGEVVADSPQLV